MKKHLLKRDSGTIGLDVSLALLTGDSNRDWCLWQLVQVLKEIAQASNSAREPKQPKEEKRVKPKKGENEE